MIQKGKKGLSPVVATTLLVAITVVLATIVFFWARGFIGDEIEKFGRKIDQSCPDVVFSVEALSSTGKIYVQNEGTVPIYGIEVRQKRFAGVNILQTEPFSNLGILAGESDRVDLPSELNTGDEIIIVPVLLGETKDKRKPQACGDDSGLEISVEN